ncbi:MAG: hypothetical protein JXA20_00480 [Spirochaetes bacterium]|nr:hypothetical protein [Spirochaetota bacterium]
MKRLARWILPAMLLTGICAGIAAAQGGSILDYYRALPGELFAGPSGTGYRYTIDFTKGKYVTKSDAGYEIHPVVDLRNGYISITDNGTGGGSILQEIALFIDRRRRHYLAVNLSSHDGITMEARFDIYRVDSGGFVKVTDSVLPKVALARFLKTPEDYPTLRKYFSGRPFYSVIYTLPRIGTTVKATLAYDQVQMHLAQPDDRGELTAQCRRFIANIKTGSLNLAWDMDRGRFTIK